MNCKEVLQIYGPMNEHLSDTQLFKKMSDLCYKQIGHGVSHEYWKKSYGSKGYINASNIRKHINDAINESGSYDPMVMAIGLARWRKRQEEKMQSS